MNDPRAPARQATEPESAPLHDDLDNRHARTLYGPGCMEFIAKKRG